MTEIQNIAKEEMKTVVESSNLYEYSRDLILNSRKLVYQTANFAMVKTYWRIGEKIVEEQGGVERSKYGDRLIAGLSEKLTAEFGKGFDKTNLGRMRQFYLTFQNVDALRQQLSWSHYRSLIRVENPKAREVYMNEAANNQWSTRFLDRQVDKHSCERLISTHKEAINELNIENEKQLRVNQQDYLLRDPVLLDLDMYVRMYDKLKRTEGDNPTIGIILCEEKDRAEVKFSVLSDNEQLFATKYKLYIPTEEELIREITQIRTLMSGD